MMSLEESTCGGSSLTPGSGVFDGMHGGQRKTRNIINQQPVSSSGGVALQDDERKKKCWLNEC